MVLPIITKLNDWMAESINKTPVAHYCFNSLIKETSKKENWATCARHGVNVQIGVWLGNGEGLIWKKFL